MTFLQALEAIPICSVAFVWGGLAFLIWYDRKHGTLYERTARELEAHAAELKARHPKD
jgi:arginine exporter protein ArgO